MLNLEFFFKSRWPNAERIRKIRGNFYDHYGLDGVIGVIDGTHIAIRPPKQDPENYINRKGFHSVIIQAVVDDSRSFTDIYVGWPGSVHDARVFRRSPLFENLESGGFCTSGTYLLGDAAYPLKRYMIVPFKDNGHLNAAQKRYLFFHYVTW